MSEPLLHRLRRHIAETQLLVRESMEDMNNHLEAAKNASSALLVLTHEKLAQIAHAHGVHASVRLEALTVLLQEELSYAHDKSDADC